MAAADIHLRLNSLVLDLDPAGPSDFIDGLFREGDMRIARIELWLRERAQPF